ncbi:flagellar hook-basal body complex protein FliE [Silvanigrella aquatica]|uniref:Flagellar hook-basal body complex protein FliE n=1 Tax=Silvanigrella aquatica TaxID=1915309 RepID=A0A1L4CZ18_9BACT|nr:flagellar hook-basal body complex protein FliE [Silvanigrella aquatica]APJ03188.1 flagellar hook-basal body complex protein FliE [Silvanigrella aquatica]
MAKIISATDLQYLKMQRDLTNSVPTMSGGGTPPNANAKTEFQDLMEKGIKEVNIGAREAEKASMDLASGRQSNIHETMLAVTKAELGFDMMVQMRNKIIEAYQEVMRMQL